jgi:hypothetical protein
VTANRPVPTSATPSRSEGEPRLTFTDRAWRKLVLYTTLCPFEIGGLGTVRPLGHDAEVLDVHLLRQDVNDISTRLDGQAVSDLMVGMVERGDDPEQLQLWWHSHAREKTFWSGEDEETISGFRNDGMVSLVVNHSLLALARRDVYVPRRTEWVWVDRPVTPVTATRKESDAVRAEIADAVRYVSDRRRERVL